MIFAQIGQCYWTCSVRAIARAQLQEGSCTFIFSLLRISGGKLFFFLKRFSLISFSNFVIDTIILVMKQIGLV